MGLPDELADAYKIVPTALNYYATKLEGIQKSAEKEDNEYGFGRPVRSALSEDLTALIGNLRSVAKEIKAKNDSKNNDWEKVIEIIQKDKDIVIVSLVKLREDLLNAQNLVVDSKFDGLIKMHKVKKMLYAIEQTAMFKLDLASV
jgi:hypothetical protein